MQLFTLGGVGGGMWFDGNAALKTLICAFFLCAGVQFENDQDPMCPTQWPSSSKVASVRRFSLLLRQDSGMPRRETVVRGTRQSAKVSKVEGAVLSTLSQL